MRHGGSVGVACAVLGAVGFSFKSVFVKGAYRYGVDAETLLALRMLYSLPWFLLLGVQATRRTHSPASHADWRALVLLGFVGYYASSYLDFLGLQHISAALERVILFVYPTLVVLYSAWRARRWPTRNMAVALALSYGGIALAMQRELRAHPGQVWLGGLFVLGSACAYAVYLLRVGALLPRLGSQFVSAWATAVACALALGQFALLRPLSSIWRQPWPVHALSMAMAVLATVLPIWLVSEAIRRIGAGPTAIIGSLGPVLTMFIAWIGLGEALSGTQLLGAACVIVGVRLASAPAPSAVTTVTAS